MPATGGFTFAERHDRPAPQARLLWRAELDPGVIAVRAEPAADHDPGGFDLVPLRHFATVVRDAQGREYLALSDGRSRVRLDVVEGSLLGSGRVRLHYMLSGMADLEPRLLSIRRLASLWRGGRFTRTLFPPAPDLPRRLEALRVADALADGASYREIAAALFGEERVHAEWKVRSDFLVTRVRRRVAEARLMAAGGYRGLF